MAMQRSTRVIYAGREWVIAQVGTEVWQPGQVRLATKLKDDVHGLLDDAADGPWVNAQLVEPLDTPAGDESLPEEDGPFVDPSGESLPEEED
jgi:hypothetical protein